MEKILSRFTFSFLMAQLFPGCILLFSLSSPLAAFRQSPHSITELFLLIANDWFSSGKRTVAFLFIAGALGMFIHGVSWIVMAWLENHKKQSERDNVTPIRESFLHQRPFWLQVLLSPFKMVLELLWVLCAPDINKLAMEESGAYMSPEEKPIYDFFQEFYLYFAQFYAHTAYALLATVFTLALSWAAMGLTGWRLGLLSSAYFGASLFYLIGRVQFASLFKTENVLRNKERSKVEYVPLFGKIDGQSAFVASALNPSESEAINTPIKS
jgi:hypothetical protein